METIPFYIPLVFIVTTVITLLLLYRASQNTRLVLIIAFLWLGIQAVLGLKEFYLVTDTIPPRLAAAVVPPLLFIIACLTTSKGKTFVDRFDAKWLTLLHAVRVPVEMVLFWLFVQKYVPQLMTFEGRNFDILTGITAPLVVYFGYAQRRLSRSLLLAWNFVCLGLLFNIVIHAMLSAPSPFQQLAFDEPNVGVLYFPFIWLPGFVVPVVLFSHLVSIRQLLRKGEVKTQRSLQVLAVSEAV